MSLKIKIMILDQLIMETPIKEVILPSVTGQIGILQDHSPLITALEIGVIRIKTDQKWTPIVVLGGVAKLKNNELLVLVSGIEEIKQENYEKDKEICRQATESLSMATTRKEKIQAGQLFKRASAKLQGYRFLN